MRKEPVFTAAETPPPQRERAATCHRRKDAAALAALVLVAGAILANALVLQSGTHPAPFFTGRQGKERPATRDVTGTTLSVLPRPRPAQAVKAETARVETVKAETVAIRQPPRPVPPLAVAKSEPVRDASYPPAKIAAVQQALAEFGYGQIKATGTIDADTRQAIEQFERHHKLPITGQVSERLTRELSTMVGRSLE
jgi:hypothetical protein